MMLFVHNYQEKVIPTSQKQTHFHLLGNIFFFLFFFKFGGLTEPGCFMERQAQLWKGGLILQNAA